LEARISSGAERRESAISSAIRLAVSCVTLLEIVWRLVLLICNVGITLFATVQFSSSVVMPGFHSFVRSLLCGDQPSAPNARIHRMMICFDVNNLNMNGFKNFILPMNLFSQTFIFSVGRHVWERRLTAW